jgi:hypothetical protein
VPGTPITLPKASPCLPSRSPSAALAGSDPEPLRHQVWDIPEIKPLVRLPDDCCQDFGVRTSTLVLVFICNEPSAFTVKDADK